MIFGIPLRICIFVHLLHILWSSRSSAFNPETCRQALGMQSGSIPDRALTASSSHDNYTHGPQNSRLNKDILGGAWCARGSILSDSYEYLQVNLSVPVIITLVATQGRYGKGQGVEYLPSYKIQFWRPGFAGWKTFKNLRGDEVLDGNQDPRSVVFRYLEPAIIAQAVRFVPHLEHPWIVCLRVELYGCNCTDNYSSNVCGDNDNATLDNLSSTEHVLATSNSTDEDTNTEESSPEAWPFILASVLVVVVVLLIIGVYCYRRKRVYLSSPAQQIRYHSPQRKSWRESVNEYETNSDKICPSPEIDFKTALPSAPLYQELDPEYNSFSAKVSPRASHLYEPVAYAETDIFRRDNEINEKSLLMGDEVWEKISRDELRFIKNIGKGKFGEVHLCVLTRNGASRPVAVKTLREGTSQNATAEYNAEIQKKALLNHPNVVKMLGICQRSGPQCMVLEHTEMGDLQRFLMTRQSVGSDTFKVKQDDKTIGFQSLLKVLHQISSGMKYLESLGHVHCDLATRNCLVGAGLTIKIGDLAVCRHQDFQGEYYLVDNRTFLPIRWMSWEACLGNYTNKSDVWSFGVTAWEVLTLCKQIPYHQLDDQAVLHRVQTHKLPPLHQPLCCPDSLYALVKTCLNKDESKRPAFAHLERELSKLL